jgi:cation diffusion facilitator family transporter
MSHQRDVDGRGHDGHEDDLEHHGHSHGLVDPSITRSRDGLKAVSVSLAVLGVTALIQTVIFLATGSVALLADLIHNYGDALTALPLGVAFLVRSFRAEKLAGLAVVAAIFISACVALYETIERFLHPEHLTHLWVLAAAGVVGFAGNEIAARVRLRAGDALASPALVADGNHARIDGFVSLGVVASAAVVALGFRLGDPIIGLVITVAILRITWTSWRTIHATEPGERHSAHAGAEPAGS